MCRRSKKKTKAKKTTYSAKAAEAITVSAAVKALAARCSLPSFSMLSREASTFTKSKARAAMSTAASIFPLMSFIPLSIVVCRGCSLYPP